jgi:hypothetical protein
MILICASHDDSILAKNLAASRFFNPCKVVRGYTNVAEAYNSANVVNGEINVYAHHDVFLPPSFESELKRSIEKINSIDPNWGVLGLYGATMENGQRRFYGHVRDRGNAIGSPNHLPHEVQTLDELLLITKGDFVFDEQFDLHFYGADICLQSIKEGRKNYAISSYVHHNSTLKMGYRSQSFKDAQEKFKNKWKEYLPINTPCALVQ